MSYSTNTVRALGGSSAMARSRSSAMSGLSAGPVQASSASSPSSRIQAERRSAVRCCPRTTLTAMRCSQEPKALSRRKRGNAFHACTKASWVQSSASACDPASRRHSAWMRPTWRRYKVSKALTSRACARATSAVSWSRSPGSMAKKVAPNTASFMCHWMRVGAKRFTRARRAPTAAMAGATAWAAGLTFALRTRATRRRFPRRRPTLRLALAQYHRARYVPFAPAHEREQHAAQVLALGRQRVGVAHRALLIRRAADDACRFEALEAIREDVGGDAFGRIHELAVGALAMQQIAHYQ